MAKSRERLAKESRVVVLRKAGEKQGAAPQKIVTAACLGLDGAAPVMPPPPPLAKRRRVLDPVAALCPELGLGDGLCELGERDQDRNPFGGLLRQDASV